MILDNSFVTNPKSIYLYAQSINLIIVISTKHETSLVPNQ